MRFGMISVFLALATGALFAQPNVYNGQGYVRFGVAGYEKNFGELYTVGTGAEGFLYRGLALGASIDYLSSFENSEAGAGILSPGASYHFVNRKDPGKFDPFFGGGYTLAFSSRDYANGFYYGGGATYWFKPRFGIRFEFRDHVIQSEHTYVLGVGFSFR